MNEQISKWQKMKHKINILTVAVIGFASARAWLGIDPSAGVASTLVAAIELGLPAYGCEISPKYHSKGSKRCEQAVLSPSFYTLPNNRLHLDVVDSPAQQALFTPEADTAEGKSPKPAPRR